MNRAACVLALAVAFAMTALATAEAQSSDTGGMQRSAFFFGGGAGYSSVNFSTESVYNKGISEVFSNGVEVATGEADGPPVDTLFSDQTKLAPFLQLGYFQHFGDSNWLWGTKFSYSYEGAISGTKNLIIPQFGTSTNSNASNFDGYSVTGSYSVAVDSQMASMAFVGASFKRGFVYLGAGPSLSNIEAKLNDVVGYATFNGKLINVSGAPQSFSSSDWRVGVAGTAGITYFLTPSWFLDVNYMLVAPSARTIFATSPFNNPGDGHLAFKGTLIGTYTADIVNSQTVTLSINKAF